ncbi:proliferating cell nuclear antigen (pcna) [Candidatus Woesearchaeota archaeon]|nr:proliferating cell nuclear antigen (pcna) [Candidatus Woesearchaeota archaeon]
MKLTIADPKLLKDSINIISDIVTEARFNITKQGLELIAMDPANVAMVIFKLLSSSFTEYDLKQDMSIGLNLNNLKQVFKRVKATDILTLEVDGSQFKITLKGATTRRFYLPIIDIEELEQKVPDLDFAVEIQTDSQLIEDAIADADIVAESVSFKTDGKSLIIEASGDLAKSSVEIKADENTKINVLKKTGEELKAKYSIEYLKKMIKSSKLSDRVVLKFSKDYPLRLDYIVKDRLELGFILAPRIETE